MEFSLPETRLRCCVFYLLRQLYPLLMLSRWKRWVLRALIVCWPRASAFGDAMMPLDLLIRVARTNARFWQGIVEIHRKILILYELVGNVSSVGGLRNFGITFTVDVRRPSAWRQVGQIRPKLNETWDAFSCLFSISIEKLSLFASRRSGGVEINLLGTFTYQR
jgi:hypothetical protein